MPPRLYKVVVQTDSDIKRGVYGTVYEGYNEPMARLIYNSLKTAGHQAWFWSCIPEWEEIS